MDNVGYTKILNGVIKWGKQYKWDHVYVRNDFRSPFFKNDGKPKLMDPVDVDRIKICLLYTSPSPRD